MVLNVLILFSLRFTAFSIIRNGYPSASGSESVLLVAKYTPRRGCPRSLASTGRQRRTERRMEDSPRLHGDYNKPGQVMGENGLLTQLTKAILERTMQAELTEHLGYDGGRLEET